MADVIPSVRTSILSRTTNVIPRRTATPATAEPNQATAPGTQPVSTPAPDFRALFTGSFTTTPAEPPPTPAAPTAESVFGPNPWIANPTGIGPDGQPYSYNKFYFATAETAAKVAQMTGGTVVQRNQFTPNGGPFSQQQPNYMVQLSDGRLINPGLVASFYTHGYSQSYVDFMVASEVRNA